MAPRAAFGLAFFVFSPLQAPPPPAPWTVSVTPNGSTTANRVPYTTGYTEVFTVHNTGENADTYFITCQGFTNITCTGVSTSSLTLDPNEQQTVTATYSTGAAGTGKLRLRAWSDESAALDTGWYNVPVPVQPPAVTLVVPAITSGSRAVVHNRQPLIRALLKPLGSAIDSTQTWLKWR